MTATIEQIVEEANAIYREYTSSGLMFELANTEKYLSLSEDFLRKQSVLHPRFAETYPIVLRYICQLGQYSPKALAKYIRHLAANPWKSEESYIDSQADYIYILYKELTPKCDNKNALTVKDEARKMLLNEQKEFKEKLRRATELVDKTEATNRQIAVEEIKQILRQKKEVPL